MPTDTTTPTTGKPADDDRVLTAEERRLAEVRAKVSPDGDRPEDDDGPPDGPLESIGKTITAPVRDTASTDDREALNRAAGERGDPGRS